MSSGRRLLASTALGLALLAAVVVVVFGFPSLAGVEESASPVKACGRDARAIALPFGVASDAGRWGRARPFPTAQDELRAEAVGDVVYVGAGLRQSGSELVSTDGLYAFDPVRAAYRPLPPLPRRVDHPGFVAADGALYVIGGFRDQVPTGEVFRLSGNTGEWVQLASLEVPRGSLAAASLGGKIVVAGGATGADVRDASGVVEIYDVSSGRWSRGRDMPTARHHADAAAIGDGVYVVGGRGERDYALDVVERYDVRFDRWQPAPRLPQGAGGLAVVGVGDRILAVGGGDDVEGWVTPATWSFDPASGRWARLADLRIARHGHGAAAVGNTVFVFGGAPCPDYGFTDSVERLDVAG